MKNVNVLGLLFFFLFISSFGMAQEKAKNQLFSVHEDVVKPSMVAEYEMLAKQLAAALKEHDIKGVEYLSAVTDDFRYLYVTPIENMAELDNNYFATLAEKMGGDNLGELFSKMDQCYEKHGNYMITMDTEMSHMPEGISQTQEGLPHRTFFEYHVTPANIRALSEVGMRIKEYHAAHESPLHYRVYRKGFGGLGDYFLIAVSSKDAAHFESIMNETMALLGEEYGALINEALSLTTRFDTYQGTIRPDLSYFPAEK